MAKLPTIRYSTGVTSLGREDVSAPGREAAASIRAAQTIARGVEDFERTVAVSQYTKNIGESKNNISELYNTVTSKEVFSSSEIPDYVSGIERYDTVIGPDGQEIITERLIPASEVREAWFQAGLRNITNAAVKGTTSPTARSRISQELRTSIGPNAYNQMLAYNRAAVKKENLAILDSSVQSSVINGDRVGMEETLFRFLASGDISRADYEVRRLRASQDVDIEAYSKELSSANTVGAVEEIYDRLSENQSATMPGPSEMTAAQRNTLRSSAVQARVILEEQRDERRDDVHQEGVAMFTEGTLTASWIRNKLRNDEMLGGTAKSLLGLIEEKKSSRIIDDVAVAGWQKEIQNRMMFTPLGTQTSSVARSMRRELMESDLNGSEIDDLLTYINKVDNDIRNNPEYKQALVSIRSQTGLPEQTDMASLITLQATGKYKIVKQAYDDFTTALFEHLDEFGAEANPLDFVKRNADVYKIEAYEKTKQTRFKQRYPELALGPVEADPESILYNLYKSNLAGEDNEELLQEIYQFWYGDSIDLSSGVFQQ